MKTYIVLTNKGMIATTASSKLEAWKKVTQSGYKANKGHVSISACHIDYVSCAKLK